MANQRLNKFLKYNISSLRLMGLWSDTGNFFDNKYYCMYAFFVNFVTCAYAIVQASYVVLNLQDLEAMSSAACVAMTCCLAGAKGQFCIWKSHLFKNLYDQLDQEVFQPRNQRQWKQTKSFMKTFTFVEIWYFTIVVITMEPLWILAPYFDNERRLPFPASYPFDWSKPGVFESLYVFQIIGLTYNSLIHVLLDMLSVGYIAFIGVQCDILADTMKNIDEFTLQRLKSKGQDHSEAEFHTGLTETMVECVHHHYKILEFYDAINKAFTMLIFSQFAISLISLCMTGLQLTVLSSSYMVFYATANYEVVIFTQLAFYCWFGNEIMLKSSGIADAIYECPWMDYPEKFKKDMLFFMLRVQKPLIVYALNFFELSLPTFKGILKASWSFFTMLHQMNVKRENARLK